MQLWPMPYAMAIHVGRFAAQLNNYWKRMFYPFQSSAAARWNRQKMPEKSKKASKIKAFLHF